ncbi:hypothetical protein ACU686_36020 [Yinghuangia aomiensis]
MSSSVVSVQRPDAVVSPQTPLGRALRRLRTGAVVGQGFNSHIAAASGQGFNSHITAV